LHFGKLSATSAILYGVKPVVIAVIVQALWGLGRTAVKTTFLGLVAAFSVVLAFLGFHPLLLLLLAGSAVCLTELRTSRALVSALPVSAVPPVAVAGTAASLSLASLFLVFLKVGVVVFGSGYVLLAFLRADLVVHRGWLTDSQLVDAVARGATDTRPRIYDRHFHRLSPWRCSRFGGCYQSASSFLRFCWLRPVDHWCRESGGRKLRGLSLTV